jgi:hypothetical protein
MATRFYLPSTGTAEISPNFGAFWAYTGGAARYPSSKTKAGTTLGLRAVDGGISVTPGLGIQFSTNQLAAYSWTTADEIKLQMALYNGTLGGNFMAVSIRVVSGDGNTVRGTLFEGYGPTGAPSSDITSRSLGADGAHVHVQNSVSQQDGDRLLIEIGIKFVHETGSDNIRPGDNQSTDLPENETDTGAKNPWVEFSPTIADYGNLIVKVINE